MQYSQNYEDALHQVLPQSRLQKVWHYPLPWYDSCCEDTLWYLALLR